MLGIFKSKKEQKIELVKEDKDILLAIADDRQGKVPRFEQAEAFTLTIVRDGKKVQKQILNLGGVSEDEILKLLLEYSGAVSTGKESRERLVSEESKTEILIKDLKDTFGQCLQR